MPHHPAALRNRGPILEALQGVLPPSGEGRVLEIASGSGCHIEHFAPAFPHLLWQPTVFPAGSDELGGLTDVHPNLLTAAVLDASQPWDHWPASVVSDSGAGSYAAVYASNLTHISPWEATLGTLAGASIALRPGSGVLVLYGPFKVEGKCRPQSNADFDASLRSQNPAWGYRDIADVAAAAAALGLTMRAPRAMPANNFLLVFDAPPLPDAAGGVGEEGGGGGGAGGQLEGAVTMLGAYPFYDQQPTHAMSEVFRRLSAAARRALHGGRPACVAEVFQIGSSAIPGMPGTPVVDMVAVLRGQGATPPSAAQRAALAAAGFPGPGTLSDHAGDDTWFFGGDDPTALPGTLGRAVLHVVSEGNPWVADAKAFVRLLSADPVAFREYAAVKREGARLAAAEGQEGQKLTDYKRRKHDVCLRLIAQARSSYPPQPPQPPPAPLPTPTGAL